MKAIVAAALVLSLAALAACGGGGSQTTNVVRSTTIGQELQDLAAAHEKGAIDDKEYAAQKRKILAGRD